MNRRKVSPSFSQSVLAYITILWLTMLPIVRHNIIEINLRAWIGYITTNCVRIKERLVDLNVLESDISNCNSWLSSTCTFFIKRIKHTARTITIRFFHLLRTYINCPPNWPIHCEILIVNVLNFASSLISRISFDINALDWPNHPNISEGYILDAIT